MTNAIDLQLVAEFGGTMLWPMIALSNIAQGSAVLGMIALQRKNEEAQEVNVPSCISCYLGVTEPAIFGVNLKYMFPFVCAMTGSALAAIFSVLTGVEAFGIGVGGLPGILSIKPEKMVFFAIAMVIAIAVPFAGTYVFGKSRGVDKAPEAPEEEEAPAPQAKKVELRAFLSGKTVAIEEVPDQVFASKALGDGIAIEPTDNVVIAPCDCVISVTMDESNHAVGFMLENGADVLIHIGLDTVNMNGKGFTCHVKNGQKVKAGEKLITFEPAVIKAAGHPAITMLVVTDPADNNISFEAGRTVKAGKDILGAIG
jgi:PTS system trehalose-specific IIC component